MAQVKAWLLLLLSACSTWAGSCTIYNDDVVEHSTAWVVQVHYGGAYGGVTIERSPGAGGIGGASFVVLGWPSSYTVNNITYLETEWTVNVAGANYPNATAIHLWTGPGGGTPGTNGVRNGNAVVRGIWVRVKMPDGSYQHRLWKIYQKSK